MSTKIHPKCPREFTQKMSPKIHSKRGLLVDKSVHEKSPKVSMRSHPFCPREITCYVHEMSATHNERQNETSMGRFWPWGNTGHVYSFCNSLNWSRKTGKWFTIVHMLGSTTVNIFVVLFCKN
jgi:hypothetical protein